MRLLDLDVEIKVLRDRLFLMLIDEVSRRERQNACACGRTIYLWSYGDLVDTIEQVKMCEGPLKLIVAARGMVR